MKTDYDTYSRYHQVEIINDGYWNRQETWDEPRISNFTGTRYVVPAKYAHRLDLIANELLGSPLLWWAIAYASGVKNPFNVRPGSTLLIPDTDCLLKIQKVL